MTRARKRRLFGRVFVHAGLPKTASSFAQTRMAELAASGCLRVTAYPTSPDPVDAIEHSGNATAIAQLLVQPVAEAFLEEQLRHELGLLLEGERPTPERNLLLSSEVFFFAAPGNARVLCRVLSEFAAAATQIVFVRPLRGWTYSVYAQMVGRHGLASEYGYAWLEDYFGSFADRFRDLVGWGMETVALPYARTGLMRTLLEALGEDRRLADEVSDARRNRGLLEEELALARMVNGYFHDPDIMAQATAAMRARWPEGGRGGVPAHVADAYAPFAAPFTARIAEIPGERMAGIRRLLLADSGPPAASQAPIEPARLMECFDIVLAQLAREGGAHARTAAHFKTLVSYAAQRLEPSHAFFDPIHYLLQHDDLLAAHVDPWAHYFEFGRLENRPSALVRKDLK